MVLHPLTQVGVGMFVSVRIGSSQLMMNVLGYRKRSQGQKKNNQADTKSAREPPQCERDTHKTLIEYHKAPRTVKMVK